jgi:hypothetical protein
MDVLKVDAVQAEKKLSIVRRYIFELLIVMLCLFSGYLFLGQQELELQIRNYLQNDRVLMIEKIDVNTHRIDDNTKALEQNSEIIQELNNSLYKTKKK